MARPTGMIIKRSGEKFAVGFKYWGEDLPAGVTIASVAVTCSPASGLTFANPGSFNAAGDEAYSVVEGGTTLIDYTLTFTVTLTDGTIYVDDYVVKVRD